MNDPNTARSAVDDFEPLKDALTRLFIATLGDDEINDVAAEALRELDRLTFEARV